jgi:hypothetical protein
LIHVTIKKTKFHNIRYRKIGIIENPKNIKSNIKKNPPKIGSLEDKVTG